MENFPILLIGYVMLGTLVLMLDMLLLKKFDRSQGIKLLILLTWPISIIYILFKYSDNINKEYGDFNSSARESIRRLEADLDRAIALERSTESHRFMPRERHQTSRKKNKPKKRKKVIKKVRVSKIEPVNPNVTSRLMDVE